MVKHLNTKHIPSCVKMLISCSIKHSRNIALSFCSLLSFLLLLTVVRLQVIIDCCSSTSDYWLLFVYKWLL